MLSRFQMQIGYPSGLEMQTDFQLRNATLQSLIPRSTDKSGDFGSVFQDIRLLFKFVSPVAGEEAKPYVPIEDSKRESKIVSLLAKLDQSVTHIAIPTRAYAA